MCLVKIDYDLKVEPLMEYGILEKFYLNNKEICFYKNESKYLKGRSREHFDTHKWHNNYFQAIASWRKHFDPKAIGIIYPHIIYE